MWSTMGSQPEPQNKRRIRRALYLLNVLLAWGKQVQLFETSRVLQPG